MDRNRKRRRLLGLAAIGFSSVAALTASPADAATRYVTPAGSGTACTQQAPCDQIREAYAVAQAGDVIQLAPGAYQGQGNWQNPTIAGTKTVTVRGNPDAPAQVKVRQLAVGGAGANVTFDGIDLDGGGTNPGSQLFDTGGGRNITFKNGRIGNVHNQKGAQAGGQSSTASLNIVFDNVEFHDVTVSGDTHSECIYSQAPGITIKNSYFDSACGSTGGVFFTRGTWWGQPCYGGFTITGNHFERQLFDHGALIWTGGPDGVGCGYVDDAVIRGNTFDGPGVVPTGPVTFRDSVESCNTPRVDGTGLVHEPCGVDPTPTPTPTPTPSPTPDPTPSPTPTPSPEPAYHPVCEPTCDEIIADLRAQIVDLKAQLTEWVAWLTTAPGSD